MVSHPKPVLYVSSCIEHESCRYDGQMIRSGIVSSLRDLCLIKHECPERSIGLGVPRRPVRIVLEGEERRLWQPATGLDHTMAMESFITGLLEGLGEIDGFILKSKSPTCGLEDVKLYPNRVDNAAIGRTSGLLGWEVLSRYPFSAIEDEARLLNEAIKDHFLTRLFANARLREAKETRKPSALVDFHTKNKILLMSYSQTLMASMGRVVSHQKETGLKEAFYRYRELMSEAMMKGPRYTSVINAIMHCFGHISPMLSSEERVFFLDTVEMYREERVSLSTLRELLRSYMVRFDVQYLKGQTIFEPYPPELMRSCGPPRDRDYWK